MPAILFGSISSFIDTSELQRAGFNLAFDKHGLNWNWTRVEYQDLLTGNGGKQRIADYAETRGQQVDAESVHSSKSSFYQTSLAKVPQLLRPGVAETIRDARAAGWQVGFVTTTSKANIDALLESVTGRIDRDVFTIIVDADSVANAKPAPDAYLYALEQLGETASHCIAIEDNLGGVAAAEAAGVPCVVFANENTSGHDFGDKPRSVHLDFAELTQLASAS